MDVVRLLLWQPTLLGKALGYVNALQYVHCLVSCFKRTLGIIT